MARASPATQHPRAVESPRPAKSAAGHTPFKLTRAVPEEASTFRRRCSRAAGDFGAVALVTIQYPQEVPPAEELRRYLAGQAVGKAVGFLDHLCHPASLMIFLLGMPRTLFYQRSAGGAGVATFTFESGAVASLALTHGAARDGGMERTMIVGSAGRHILVENNIRLALRRGPAHAYGKSPDYFTGEPSEASAVWEPEFSLGQLYNKGLFLLGYYNEIHEFCRAVLERRPVAKGTLRQAWQVTRIFEAFCQGPGKVIDLPEGPAA